MANYCSEDKKLELPKESTQWQPRNDMKEKHEESITSSSFSKKHIGETRYQERLATVQWENEDSIVRIFKSRCFEVETELKLIGRGCWWAISFQDKLAFIGGWRNGIGRLSSVELMDPSTGHVSSLPEMSYARMSPACAASDFQIFVFGDCHFTSPGAFTSEFYENGSSSWLPLPPMIVERFSCAAVYIPDTGVLILGGQEIYSSPSGLRNLSATELLTCETGEGKYKWTWHPTVPMLKEYASPGATYFQQRVYVVDYGCEMNDMEMLNLSAGVDDCQWTSLASLGPFKNSFRVDQMAKVENKLFLSDGENGDIYAVELETDPKIQHKKFGQIERSPFRKESWAVFMARVRSL